jgi:uncharacterized protein (TIGR02996 family)
MVQDELLRAVLDDPTDDTRRLVLADALLEHGDVRGELIALQCQKAPNEAAVARAAELVELVKPAWQEILGESITEMFFERGFPTSVELWIAGEGDDTLVALDRSPVHRVKLRFDEDVTDADTAALAFKRDPRAARIGYLDLSWESWGEDALRAILSPPLTRLRGLAISDSDSQTFAAQAIVANKSLRDLESLHLCPVRTSVNSERPKRCAYNREPHDKRNVAEPSSVTPCSSATAATTPRSTSPTASICVSTNANRRSLSVSPSTSASRAADVRVASSATARTVPLCANTNEPRRNGCVLSSLVSPTVFWRTCASTSAVAS